MLASITRHRYGPFQSYLRRQTVRSRPPEGPEPTWTPGWVRAESEYPGERYHGTRTAVGRPVGTCSHLHTHPALAISCARTDFGRLRIDQVTLRGRNVRSTPQLGQLDLLELDSQTQDEPPF